MEVTHYALCSTIIRNREPAFEYVYLTDHHEVKQCVHCGAYCVQKTKYKAIPVKKLTRFGLKYAVAMAEGFSGRVQIRDDKDSPLWVEGEYNQGFDPDTDPALFVKLLIKYRGWITPPVDDLAPNDDPHGWDADTYDSNDDRHQAMGHPDPMTALCWSIVYRQFGKNGKVRIPVRLLEAE